jgi:SH3-like domain-containing protein
VSRGPTAPLLAAAGALAAALAATPTRAETLYVVEQLVVNVNSAPDASGERIATVKSGEGLEVLEHAGQQVHVRLADGRDGWIRAGYLSADEPLRTRLAAREAEIAPLRKQIGTLESELAAARAAPAASGVGAAPGAAGNATTATRAAPAATLLGLPDDAHPRRVWPWALASALLALGAGFALGVLTLDRHVRRKYGGLRIY